MNSAGRSGTGGKPAISTVIFDWSGVLSNDWKATVETTNDVLEIYGQKRLSEEEFKKHYQLPWINFYKNMGLEVDIKNDYELWYKEFPKHAHSLEPFPKAKQTLAWTKGKGKKVIVFSAHNQKLLEQEVKDYGFSGLIDSVNASIPDKRKRIDKLVISHEIERDSTIYVGDMCHDIETARMAGIKSVAVLGGYESKEKLEKENPNYLIQNIGELPALIEKIEANGHD